ncbi:hypothetical protein G6F56_011428 [Rhizopus delemar]|uniref:Small nuclear ribonucleoprotein 35kDa (U11 U12) n=1 Tax=Rhizopus stolonifer TaxID=4846 RepID=A0A367KIY7_RHIST|nr:hypothetical protein G6F56_011428 [Rhizopus delemar]RCI01812.1 small nuclear ribonucleoprotein 35kDa (U11 U12) [Rhizopus stolonifer]
MWYSKEYDPIKVGFIDGNGKEPHDRAVKRAANCDYKPPKHLDTSKYRTLFVGRLNFDTTEETLRRYFEKYGEIKKTLLIRNNVTGLSQGYGFITFKSENCARDAYDDANRLKIDDHRILVDYERSRLMKGWIPRRLGGGYGGQKESGQLRFGGRDRPFREKSEVSSDFKKSDHWKYPSHHYERSSKRRRH